MTFDGATSDHDVLDGAASGKVALDRAEWARFFKERLPFGGWAWSLSRANERLCPQYLYCASEGFSTVIRAMENRDELAKSLRLRPEQKIMLSQTVGYPSRTHAGKKGAN